MDKYQALSRIVGLRIEDNELASDADDSRPAILKRCNCPMNIVFHGHGTRFTYDYYGIHPGTEDRLTFVGPKNKKFVGGFIDCRDTSSSWGVHVEVEFQPSVNYRLCIPAGVAHIFDGLEDVYTLNDYEMFLPEPDEWAASILDFRPIVETVNIPRGAAAPDLPKIKCNKRKASHAYYQLVMKNIENNLDGIVQAYPLTKEFKFRDGDTAVIRLTKQPIASEIPRFEAIGHIDGLGWHRKLFVTSGDEAEGGFFVIRPSGSCKIYDQARDGHCLKSSEEYRHSERRITLLGSSNRAVRLSINNRNVEGIVISAFPSPLRELSIPPGYDYCIESVEGLVIVEQAIRV